MATRSCYDFLQCWADRDPKTLANSESAKSISHGKDHDKPRTPNSLKTPHKPDSSRTENDSPKFRFEPNPQYKWANIHAELNCVVCDCECNDFMPTKSNPEICQCGHSKTFHGYIYNVELIIIKANYVPKMDQGG